MTRIVIGSREMRIFDMARKLLNSSAPAYAGMTEHVFELTLLDSPTRDSKEISVNAHAAGFSPLPYSAFSDVISFFKKAFGVNGDTVTIEGLDHNIHKGGSSFEMKGWFLHAPGVRNSEKSIKLFGLRDKEHFREMLTSWGLDPGTGDFPELRPLEMMYFLLRVKLKQKESSDAAQTAPYPWIPGQWYRFEGYTSFMFLGVRDKGPKGTLWWGRPSSSPDVRPKEYPQLAVGFHETAARLNWTTRSIESCQAGNITPCEAPEAYRTPSPTAAAEGYRDATDPVRAPVAPPVPAQPVVSESSAAADWIPGQWYAAQQGRDEKPSVRMFLGKNTDRAANKVYWGTICSVADVVISEYPDVPEHLRPIARRLNWAANTREFYKSWHSIVPCPAPKGYESTPLPEPVPPNPPVQQDPYSVAVTLLSI